MKTKSLDNLSGDALSRTQLKAILAGQRPPDIDCASECFCNDEQEKSHFADGTCICNSGFAIPCAPGVGPY